VSEARRDEIILEFSQINGVTVRESDNMLQRVHKHLLSPDRKRMKILETEIATKKINMSAEYGQNENATRPPQKCKMCGRVVTSRNAIAGMGPTCAKDLLDSLTEDQIRKGLAGSDIARRDLKKLSDLKDDNLYPIMVLKNAKTGNVFTSDIKRKENDGRFLTVDLSSLAKETKVIDFTTMIKDTLKVSFDEHNYEIAKVYGSVDDLFKN